MTCPLVKKDVTFRTVSNMIDDNTMEFEMYMTPPGSDKETKGMKITYKRICKVSLATFVYMFIDDAIIIKQHYDLGIHLPRFFITPALRFFDFSTGESSLLQSARQFILPERIALDLIVTIGITGEPTR